MMMRQQTIGTLLVLALVAVTAIKATFEEEYCAPDKLSHYHGMVMASSSGASGHQSLSTEDTADLIEKLKRCYIILSDHVKEREFKMLEGMGMPKVYRCDQVATLDAYNRLLSDYSSNDLNLVPYLRAAKLRQYRHCCAFMDQELTRMRDQVPHDDRNHLQTLTSRVVEAKGGVTFHSEILDVTRENLVQGITKYVKENSLEFGVSVALVEGPRFNGRLSQYIRRICNNFVPQAHSLMTIYDFLVSQRDYVDSMDPSVLFSVLTNKICRTYSDDIAEGVRRRLQSEL